MDCVTATLLSPNHLAFVFGTGFGAQPTEYMGLFALMMEFCTEPGCINPRCAHAGVRVFGVRWLQCKASNGWDRHSASRRPAPCHRWYVVARATQLHSLSLLHSLEEYCLRLAIYAWQTYAPVGLELFPSLPFWSSPRIAPFPFTQRNHRPHAYHYVTQWYKWFCETHVAWSPIWAEGLGLRITTPVVVLLSSQCMRAMQSLLR